MKHGSTDGPREGGKRDHAAEPSDADLLRRVGQGDLASLGTLYDRHHESVRRFVARSTGAWSDAEDITHETFLTLPRIAGRYDGRASARRFFRGVAAQLLRRRGRELAKRARATAELEWSGTPTTTPEDAASATEERRLFDRALEGLTEEKRVVVLMLARHAMGSEEIAQALEIPVGTVWTRLHYARRDLRRALDPDLPYPPG